MTADRSGIRARLAAATDGPWEAKAWAKPEHGSGLAVEAGMWLVADPQMDEDADLIAHAPTDLAALLAELDAKDAALARGRELANSLADDGDYIHSRGYQSAARRLRAALDGDGTPGPTNATDAPTVAKRAAQTTPNPTEG